MDYIVIMGYDEHTLPRKRSVPSPLSPLWSRGITDTLEEVPKEKVINAIPILYQSLDGGFRRGSAQSEALAWMRRRLSRRKHGIVTSWDGQWARMWEARSPGGQIQYLAGG